MKPFFYIFTFCFALFSCGGNSNRLQEVGEGEEFDFFLNEKTMIFNQEQDNTMEGTYLKVKEYDPKFGFVTVNIPDDFYLNSNNIKNWVLGYGMEKPYYDAGVENIYELGRISHDTIWFSPGKPARGGEIWIKAGQKICFWNKSASGFEKKHSSEIISTSFFKGFTGNSLGFSSVVYDSSRNLWLTTINEVDTDSIQTYVASSENLIDWKAENDSLPILKASDFKGTWCRGTNRSGTVPQSALVYDIIKKDSLWYMFIDGYDDSQLRHIGLVTTPDLIKGPFKVHEKPLISPTTGWMNKDVYYPKVSKTKNGYIIFFAAEATTGVGVIAKATSSDLFNWKVVSHPIINDHVGWRTKIATSSPNYIEVKDSIVYLMVAGTKQFTYGKNNNKFESPFGMGLSGNVGDAQLGVYRSTDFGNTFVPHRNNPIFNNNYADSLENEHMGGNFEKITWNEKVYVIYQAKTIAMGHRYSIYIREKALN